MELFLVLNGFEVDASVDEQEAIFLRLADAQMTRDEFTVWVVTHVIPYSVRQPE